MRIRMWLLIFLTIAGAGSVWAHEIEWVNGKTYDYRTLTAGRNCCTDVQRECRPAFEYWRAKGGWKLRIPRDGGNPKSEVVVVFVAETNVTYQDLAGDGVAHTCGGFTNGQWGAFCTFIPPGQTSEWRPPKEGRHSYFSNFGIILLLRFLLRSPLQKKRGYSRGAHGGAGDALRAKLFHG